MLCILFIFAVAVAVGGKQRDLDRMWKMKDSHWDAKQKGLASSDVENLRKIPMKGERGTRPRKGKFSKCDNALTLKRKIKTLRRNAKKQRLG